VGDHLDGHLEIGSGSFTLSLWANVDDTTGTYQTLVYKGATGNWDEGYSLGTSTDGLQIAFSVDDDQNGTPVVQSPNATVTYDDYYHIVGVVDRTNNRLRIYNNGSEVGSGTDISTLGDVAWDRELQFPWAGSYDYDGHLDEVRISNGARSACWIDAEYKNQKDNSTFYDVESTECDGSTAQFDYRRQITIDHTKVGAITNTWQIQANDRDAWDDSSSGSLNQALFG